MIIIHCNRRNRTFNHYKMISFVIQEKQEWALELLESEAENCTFCVWNFRGTEDKSLHMSSSLSYLLKGIQFIPDNCKWIRFTQNYYIDLKATNPLPRTAQPLLVLKRMDFFFWNVAAPLVIFIDLNMQILYLHFRGFRMQN